MILSNFLIIMLTRRLREFGIMAYEEGLEIEWKKRLMGLLLIYIM